MRSTRLGKIAAASLTVALLAAACGGDDDDDSTAGGSGDAACDLSLGMFGALTGDASGLGIPIRNGVELAINQYNADNADCEVNLEEYDSQGSPDAAPALAQEAINNDAVVGIVGPAFSGESNAANPLFDEAGLPIITASATNPGLSENGWSIFHRILGNDNDQGPAAANYIRDVLGATKVFVVDDASDYGKGLADIVREQLTDITADNDTVQAGQTDFAATVTKARSSGADAIFFGGYYTEAGLLTKQLRDAGITATFVAGDGVREQGYIDAAGAAAAEGAVLTCPCLPNEASGGTFVADYEAEFGEPPAIYAAEAYDAANVFLAAIAAGNSSREDINAFVNEYDEPGVTKQVKFTETGEIEEVVVWAYKVEGGEIIPDQEIPLEGQ